MKIVATERVVVVVVIDFTKTRVAVIRVAIVE